VADRFGDLVRRQRLALGLTQAELAELTALSIRSIGDLERGVTGEPRTSSRRLLRRALKLPEPAVPEPAGSQIAPQLPRKELQ
jgi:transcriptional regulator with XRE-family HTH domain